MKTFITTASEQIMEKINALTDFIKTPKIGAHKFVRPYSFRLAYSQASGPAARPTSAAALSYVRSMMSSLRAGLPDREGSLCPAR